MIYSRTLGLVLLFVALFSASVWAGYAAHGFWVAGRQVDQPGWCCVGKKSACVVAQNNDVCTAQGGSVFNWDQDACNAICSQAKTKKAKAAAPSIK